MCSLAKLQRKYSSRRRGRLMRCSPREPAVHLRFRGETRNGRCVSLLLRSLHQIFPLCDFCEFVMAQDIPQLQQRIV